MNIEEYIIDYLGDALTVSVSGSVPHPMPDEFVTLEKTGGSVLNHIPTAQIHVDSWSTSRAAAAALSDLVAAAMEAMAAEDEISRCALISSYNNPSLTTDKPRYSATFEVVYLF